MIRSITTQDDIRKYKNESTTLARWLDVSIVQRKGREIRSPNLPYPTLVTLLLQSFLSALTVVTYLCDLLITHDIRQSLRCQFQLDRC